MLIEEELDALVMRAAGNDSDFYRKRWKGASAYETIPSISRSDFLATSTGERRYCEEGAVLTKIVRAPEGMFLSEWTVSSIGRERYGIPSERPLVYLHNAHEAIEKTMWCYEHNMLPLTAEGNPGTAAFAAGKFRADSLITDPQSLLSLEPYLRERKIAPSVISIISDLFDTGALRRFRAYTKRLRLVLALPETGAFAEAEYADEPRFVPHPGVFLEHGERLTLTKMNSLLTPIIKYQTSIATRSVGGGQFVIA